MDDVNWKTGVYCWKNRVNGKRYVGSAAVSLLVRMRDYRWRLPRGLCHNSYLQRAWNKYGGYDAFVFCVLERCPPSKCVEREQYWIDHYKSANSRFGYNLCPKAGSCLGIKRSDETRKKLRQRKLPAGFGEKVAERNRNTPMSQETRAKKSEALKMLWSDPEWRANQIAKRKGKKASLETRAKMSKAGQGRRHTEESKELMSAVVKERMQNDRKRYAELVLRNRRNARRAAKTRWAKVKIRELIDG